MAQRNIARLLVLLLTAALLAAPVSANAGQRLAVERQVYEYLTGELKLSTAAACGVLANIEHESAFQPTIFGDQGTSFGLCQWHNERFTALRGFCASLGLDYRSVEGQLAYLKYELGTNYTTLLLTLQSIDNTPDGAYRAGYLWCVHFEKPSDTYNKAMARGELARGKYWARYNSYSPIIIAPMEPEPEPDPQTLIEQLKQNPVTIPLPPQEEGSSSGYVFQKPDFIYYVPRNLPGMAPAPEAEPVPAPALPWEYPALAAIAAAMVLVLIFPGKKKRRKVYSEGRFVVK